MKRMILGRGDLSSTLIAEMMGISLLLSPLPLSVSLSGIIIPF